MTTIEALDYLRDRLPHEPRCDAPYLIDSADPSQGVHPCTCRRAEVLARVEKMEAFVEAWQKWSRRGYADHSEMRAAFARLEGE